MYYYKMLIIIKLSKTVLEDLLMNTLGKRIKTRRKELGLTQEDLAGEFLSRAMISLIERDQTKPSLKVLEYLSNTLGLSMGELLSEKKGVMDGPDDSFNISKVLSLCSSLIKSQKYDDAEKLLQDALVRFDNSIDTKGDLLLNYAQVCIYQNKFENGIKFLKEALVYIPPIELLKHIEVYYLISSAYKNIEDYHSSIENALYALLLITKSDINSDQALININILYNLSFCYCRIDEHKKGLDYINQALMFQEKTGIFYLQSSFLMLNGLANLFLNNIEEGILSTKKALTIFQKPKEVDQIVGCITNLGILYRKANKLEQSLKYLNESLELCKNNRFETYRVNSHYELSLTYLEAKDFNSSIEHASEGIFHVERLKKPILRGKLLTVLAKTYYQLEQYGEALTFANQAERLFENEKNHKQTALLLSIKSDIFFKQEHYSDAYKTLKKAMNLILN